MGNFPRPGTVLWGVEVELEKEVFRSGASSKPSTDYLRYIDIGRSDPQGRIEGNDRDLYTVKPGKGISLFLQRMIPEGLVVVNPDQWKEIDKKGGKNFIGGELSKISQFPPG